MLLQQAEPPCGGDGLPAVRGVELAVERPEVGLDRVHAEHVRSRDLVRGQQGGQVAQELDLAR